MASLQVVTLGCSKNTVDTEHLLFQVSGDYEVVPEGENRPVDVLLVNTCGFIGDAKEESVNAVMDAVARKRDGSAGKVLVFGCLAQRYGATLRDLIPEVDGWFGARDTAPLLRALGCKPAAREVFGRLRPERARKPYAYLKISEGCDRSCAYCAIPLIRGRHRSVPMEMLVAEAGALAAQGVRELVVIAQDTTCYGQDLYGRQALGTLLGRLSEVEGIQRIRLHYAYPDGFPQDVLELMAFHPKVCRYLDIPLQHISDRVLSCMRRGMDADATRRLVRRLRDAVPGIVLRTTLMVGHPGEGRAEFRELMDFVRETRFPRMGAFAYSEEEGTYGARHFPDTVSRRAKASRLTRLMALQQEISLQFNQSRVGQVERVLVDAVEGNLLVCRGECDSPEVDGEVQVTLPEGTARRGDPGQWVGAMLDVRVTQADVYDVKAVAI